jgi:hypothetical protein
MAPRPGALAPALLLALAAAWAAACGHRDRPARSADHAAPTGPQAEAELLGGQLFELVDRTMDYNGSHRGRPATELSQLGLDSLTHETVSRMTVDSGAPTITVAFRRPAGHTLEWCRGASGVLEEASLNGGQFTVLCGGPAGQANYLVSPVKR